MKNILSPQEKAKDLVDKMMLYSFEKEDYIDGFPKYIVNYKIKKEYAKQCALIAVDEYLLWSNNDNIEYWQEVKQEIEKL